jgi:DNA polymerase-3 subunit delta
VKLWEFKKLADIPNVFLFYGDEFYLDLYSNKITKKFENNNIMRLYFDEWDFDISKNYLSQNSLFGDKNILVVKTNKWSNDFAKIASIAQDNYFYLFYYGDSKQVKTKGFGNNFVRFFKPDLREMIILSNEYMKSKNISIDLEHLKYLISKIDYRFLFREIDKVSMLKNISKNSIDKLLFDYSQTSFDELFDALFSKQEYLKKLEYILYEGVDEIAVLMAFVRYVNNLYMFNLHIKNISHENVSKDVLGYQLPKQIEEIRKKISIQIKEEQFLQIFEILFRNELAMKSSKDKHSLIFQTFIEINILL